MATDFETKIEIKNQTRKEIKKILDKQIKEINHKNLFNSIFLYLEEKHKETNLETLDINLDMNLKEIHKNIYKITIFDTIETMKNFFKDMFIIFTDYYYKECGFDKFPERYYYDHIINKFFKNKNIREIIEEAVLVLVQERQFKSGISLDFYYKLVLTKNYDIHKNNGEPILSFHIAIESVYRLIRKLYLETGEIKPAMLDMLSEVVKILAHEDTKKIINEIKMNNYNEHKMIFSDWLSFSYNINETDQIDEIYLDVESLLKIIIKKRNISNCKEVYNFAIDQKVFRKLIKQISTNDEIMKILNNVYINTMKEVIEKNGIIKLEIKKDDKTETVSLNHLLFFYAKQS